ncbi:F-box/FBD/LRR-repeat protein [Spatholobus suberectus]|nr:F-box/FBD/LRR-repeat protein [Spatholobus suberectus]
MTKPTRKRVRRGNHGRLDTINQLPYEVLCHIISFLSVDEVVRSNIFSKRWKPLWKHASCPDFDGRYMIKPLSQLENSLAGKLTNYALNSSTSSTFESCEKLKVLKLKKMLMKDGIVNGILKNCLCLENFSPIESVGFKKLKIQKSSLKFLELQLLVVDKIEVLVEDLQVVVLNSLICPAKGLRIFAPKLKSFHSYCNATTQRMLGNKPRKRT